jgi:hypothetical protein
MRPHVLELTQVRVEIDGHSHPAEALELTGHRAAIRSPHAFAMASDVRLVLDWAGGLTTALPAVVRAVGPAGRDHLAHVEVTGVEGAWEPFLAFVGPTLVLS